MLLHDAFKAEWYGLGQRERRLVLEDFREMLMEEYDTPDITMSDMVAWENAHMAVVEYRRRIGSGNLASYAACLVAGENLKATK